MTGSLMAYVPSALVAGLSQVAMVPDYANNRYYMPSTATGTPGISQFTGLLSGDCTLQKTQTQLGIGAFQDFPICLTYNGNLVSPAGNGSNSIALAQFRAADLSFISTAFSSSSRLAPSNNANLLASEQLVPIRYGRTDAVLSTPAAYNEGEIALIGIPEMGLTNLGNTTETGRACMGRGAIGAQLGTAYVIGRGTNIFGSYVVNFASTSLGIGLVRLRGYVPTDIDSTWSTLSDISGVAYDQTDGNIIIGVQTSDSVTTKSYICKLSGTTGNLIWKLAVPYASANATACWANSSIVNGRFYVWAGGLGGGTLYSINTVAGTITAQTQIQDMSIGQAGISEDTNDSILTTAAWDQGATVPNYIGTYMGTLGNTTYSGWMRYFPSGPTAPLPPAPPPLITGPPVVGVNKAWSYVLDGHTFYVLDLGAQGTFVYDKVTNQWSNFATGTLNTVDGPQPQWNMQNGCMWGTRIMGCDLALPTVWEQCPANVLDNDATQITHLVTGGINTRSRTYISTDAVRISGSFGFLDSTGVVTFNLRYSDDQEATWSDYFPVTLTPGNYDDEIAWRSLGSFMAPGRIFEFSDAGGLIRIDGCDAFLNGFDNDQQTQDGSDQK